MHHIHNASNFLGSIWAHLMYCLLVSGRILFSKFVYDEIKHKTDKYVEIHTKYNKLSVLRRRSFLSLPMHPISPPVLNSTGFPDSSRDTTIEALIIFWKKSDIHQAINNSFVKA